MWFFWWSSWLMQRFSSFIFSIYLSFICLFRKRYFGSRNFFSIFYSFSFHQSNFFCSLKNQWFKHSLLLFIAADWFNLQVDSWIEFRKGELNTDFLFKFIFSFSDWKCKSTPERKHRTRKMDKHHSNRLLVKSIIQFEISCLFNKNECFPIRYSPKSWSRKSFEINEWQRSSQKKVFAWFWRRIYSFPHLLFFFC